MAQAEARILAVNLAVLGQRDPVLAAKIRAAAPDPLLAVTPARSGLPVPVASTTEGVPIPLHSLYDPVREAERRAVASRTSGCVVAFGLGAGYHLRPLLAEDALHVLIVIEKDPSTLRSLLAMADVSDLLRDPRTRLAAGCQTLRSLVLDLWKPALMGDLATVPLRSWCERSPEFFSLAAAELQAAIDDVRADYGVQAHFGKRWLANILANLPRAGTATERLPHAEEVSVTGAGPSLAPWLEALSRQSHRLIVATDTSLPALLRAGARPGVVVSIDCQSHGYLHFLQGWPPGALLAADLAAPPLVVRRAPRVLFLASGHPFVAYVSSRWRDLCPVDMSGGNVTHAAVSLAAALGARRIGVYGADFSYPRGASYCRGTYIHDLFMCDQSRVSPSETRFFAFLHRAPDIEVEHVAGSLRFVPDSLRMYQDRLARLIGEIEASVEPVPGEGLELPTTRKDAKVVHKKPWAPPRPRDDWRRFLSGYAADLSTLDLSGLSGPRFARLTEEEKLLWSTVLPIAARIRREEAETTSGREAVARARDWAVARAGRAATGPEPSQP